MFVITVQGSGSMVRMHLNTCVVFVSAAMTGALLSLVLRHSHRVTDKFWLRRDHQLAYQAVLQDKQLVRTEDTLHAGSNVRREDTSTVP